MEKLSLWNQVELSNTAVVVRPTMHVSVFDRNRVPVMPCPRKQTRRDGRLPIRETLSAETDGGVIEAIKYALAAATSTLTNSQCLSYGRGPSLELRAS